MKKGDTMLPTKLKKDKVAEAVCELRFETSLDSSLILGLFFGESRTKYPNIETLPINNIPEAVRQSDPNLVFLPTHRIKGSDHRFNIQIGSRSVSIVTQEPYCGWSDFKSEILYTLDIIRKQEIVKHFVQLGLKYIDFFDENLLELSKISININDRVIKSESSNLNVSMTYEENIISNIQVANKVDVHFTNSNINKNGSILSIDNIIVNPDMLSFDNIESTIEKAHDLQKKLFFEHIIKKDYLETLEPEY
ncbi:TIGR04255 family protein [Seleniivibrio woodruffii]|uniref:TIGR04255 family protein n=1 Tax=Seleniivibrio woodruffii TaxID=1078050 RepID=UPI0024090FB4|nr:TIGR04255 family protein [Seleniivibrio woodruffii]